MPQFKQVETLYQLAKQSQAKELYTTFKKLDNLWKPPPKKTSPISPRNASIISPVDEATSLHHETVKRWLKQMPIQVLEDLTEQVLSIIESAMLEDKDRKLILTLINIEKSKQSDFFFGVYSMFLCLKESGVTVLPFTKKLWFCIWEYEQIICSTLLVDCLSSSLPHFEMLLNVNLAYIANDKITYILARNCPRLEDLSLENSAVSDRGLRFLGGRLHPFLDLETIASVVPNEDSGCQFLRRLNLRGCSGVTEVGVWFALERLSKLELLHYQQTFSVAEILCKRIGGFTDSDLSTTPFRLTKFEHPFPYGLIMNSDLVSKLICLIPHVTSLNIVTTDATIGHLTRMVNLVSVTLELEDYFGMGLFKFISTRGSSFQNLSLSCSSDLDSVLTNDTQDGRPYQFFNAALKMARRFCPDLINLNISGCGLVSAVLLDTLDNSAVSPSWPRLSDRHLTKLESLVFLSYDEDMPVQACEEKLLLQTLQHCRNLKCISLEGNFSIFFNDAFLLDVLQVNPLSELAIFDISSAPKVPMTYRSAVRLLSLPKIRELRLTRWDMSTEEYETRIVKDIVNKSANLDLLVTRRDPNDGSNLPVDGDVFVPI